VGLWSGHLSQRRENLIGGGQSRWIRDIPAVRDLGVLIDHEDGASEDVLEARRGRIQQPVRPSEIAVEVAQQDQVFGQAELRAPGVMGPGGVDANAIDLGRMCLELVDAFSELGKLVGSTRAEVEDIGQQDDGATLERF
jgi:hypothetical protein